MIKLRAINSNEFGKVVSFDTAFAEGVFGSFKGVESGSDYGTLGTFGAAVVEVNEVLFAAVGSASFFGFFFAQLFHGHFQFFLKKFVEKVDFLLRHALERLSVRHLDFLGVNFNALQHLDQLSEELGSV